MIRIKLPLGVWFQLILIAGNTAITGILTSAAYLYRSPFAIIIGGMAMVTLLHLIWEFYIQWLS